MTSIHGTLTFGAVRRGEPERIYQAQRAGIFNRLQGVGQFSPEFWDDRSAWIAENRRRR
jgi:hypothetical protein